MAIDCDDSAWLETELAAIEALIVAMRSGITAVAGGAQSYTLDTGQTRQTVTKSNLSEFVNKLNALYNIRATLRAQLGCGQMNVVPGF